MNRKSISSINLMIVAFLAMLVSGSAGFSAFVSQSSRFNSRQVTSTTFLEANADDSSSNNSNDPAQIVGRRIIVKGDVNGGYVRTCIQNEASRFRRLIGTMSPPEESDTAEIYVEGKRRNVDGFIRWCSKGSKNVGLSQALEVVEVVEENPTGLYDDFYVKTRID